MDFFQGSVPGFAVVFPDGTVARRDHRNGASVARTGNRRYSVDYQEGKLISHIPASALYETAAGTNRLARPECIHLRTCEFCQQVLEVFITGVVGNPLPRHADRPHAAA